MTVEASEKARETTELRDGLTRELTNFSNFAVSFSIISILTGLTSLYSYGLQTGGPVAIIWGWVMVASFVLTVGFSMAEICSAYPSAGGCSYWSSLLTRLAQKDNENAGICPRFVGWLSGWFSLCGWLAACAGVNYGLTLMISSVLSIAMNIELNKYSIVFLNMVITLSQGIINSFGTKLLKYLNSVSVWWNIFGTFTVLASLFWSSAPKQSASFVFGSFENYTGIDCVPYVWLIGLLMSGYTLTGYDSSASMSDETQNPAIAGPVGIIMAIVVSFITGLLYLITLTFSIQDYETTALNPVAGVSVAQIFLDNLSRSGALALLVIVVGAQYFCGNSCITGTSRLMMAFARTGALPKRLSSVNTKFSTPLVSIWVTAAMSVALTLPTLVSDVAFEAITSVCTISLNITYGLPILLRLTIAKRHFKKGPFTLGRFSNVLGWIAVCWVAFLTILFVIPTRFPVTLDTLNFSPIMLAGVLSVVVLGWTGVPVLGLQGAKSWYLGSDEIEC